MMPLESLLELVETLQSRIDEHGAALRQSEALTRAALIDPLLRELGWNTEDPALVMPEYRLGRGYADYALLHNGKPVIMVEAKKLGTPLHEAASQGIGYCIEDGIGYFAVTDGGQWEIYETHKMAPIAEKLTVQFDIEQSPPMTCLKAMALWRHSVQDGIVSAGQVPVLGFESNTQTPAASPSSPPSQPNTVIRAPSAAPNTPTVQQTHTTISKTGEWTPLSELAPTGNKPAAMMFPDDSQKDTTSWAQLIEDITRWLWDNKYLNSSDLPIKSPRGAARYIVSYEPKHPTGEDFRQSKPNSAERSHFYVEAQNNARQLVENAQLVIEHTGQDPAQFKVRLR